MHPSGGQVMVYQHLAACLASNQPIYGLQSHTLNNSLPEYDSIDKMAVEYAKDIRQHQPNGLKLKKLIKAGYFDTEGYIYICDRIKDMICCASENIYPAEIENILYEHPAVAEVAVIGVPDADFGETIKAIVVLKAGMHATALDIIQFVRGKLADFKLPRSVEFAESLPRTPSGKLQKAKLRKKYWQGYQRKVN
ncbi:hypothetical protein LC653_20135 [Nostoc sp. CHAB 5784]|nr:thioesterase domain-containing protein [Nostoc mirabile]MCC5666168.1 hypothetical protein [Nostoc mirabile CHAB5784]